MDTLQCGIPPHPTRKCTDGVARDTTTDESGGGESVIPIIRAWG